MDDGCGCDSYLLRMNVGDARLRHKGALLLVGSCMLDRYSDIVKEITQKDGEMTVLHVCLEEIHMNHAGYKVASIIRYSDIKQVSVLTVDGSPHCVQLHYLIEDIKQHFTPEIETRHYVVEKGEVGEVSPQAVKQSRHLLKIQKKLE